MKIKELVGILFIPFFLIACGRAAAPAATQAIISNVASPITQTRTYIPTWTPTRITTSDYASKATHNAAPFGNTCPESEVLRNMASGGKWTFCDLVDEITAINKQGQSWTFSYERDFGAGGHVGYTNLIHWELEEDFLYFAPMAIVDGNRALPYNSLALYRMDLTTGEVQTVLPPSGTNTAPHFYTLSISPTGRRLAYIFETSVFDPAEIIVLDLRTGEKKSIRPGATYTEVGWFSWSADGMEMTYSVYDRSINRAYYFTYDMTTFELIRSEPFNP